MDPAAELLNKAMVKLGLAQVYKAASLQLLDIKANLPQEVHPLVHSKLVLIRQGQALLINQAIHLRAQPINTDNLASQVD